MIVVRLVDPARARDPQSVDEHAPRASEIIDIRRKPSAMIQLPHVIARLVVTANDDGKDRGNPLARVVLVKRAERVILGWNGQARKVVRVPQRLEVAAQEEEVDLVPLARLVLAQCVVDCRKAAVAASLDRNLALVGRWR